MKTFEIVIFNFDDGIEYDRYILKCDTYDVMLKAATMRCREIMEIYLLDDVCWNYTEVI